MTIGGFQVSRRSARFMFPMCVSRHLPSFLVLCALFIRFFSYLFRFFFSDLFMLFVFVVFMLLECRSCCVLWLNMFVCTLLWMYVCVCLSKWLWMSACLMLMSVLVWFIV